MRFPRRGESWNRAVLNVRSSKNLLLDRRGKFERNWRITSAAVGCWSEAASMRFASCNRPTWEKERENSNSKTWRGKRGIFRIQLKLYRVYKYRKMGDNWKMICVPFRWLLVWGQLASADVALIHWPTVVVSAVVIVVVIVVIVGGRLVSRSSSW